MSEVSGNWETWDTSYFVDQFINGTKFGQPSATLNNLQPLYDLTRVVAVKTNTTTMLLNGAIQHAVLSMLSEANVCKDDDGRRKVIEKHIDSLYRKYGLIRDI